MNAKYFITAVAIYLAISSYTIRSQHSDYYYVDEYEYVYEEVSADGSYYYLYDDDYEDEDTNHVGSPEPHDRSHLSQDMPASPGIATKKKRIPVGANPDFYYGYDIEDEEEVTAPVEVKKRKKVEIKTSIINPEFIHEVARANHHCLPHGESEELWSLRHNATIQSSEAAKQQQSAGTPSQDTSKSKPPPAFRIPLGADCEALSCGSCRVIVEEFAKSLHPINVTDRMAHISDLDVLKKFCQSGPVRLKYSAMTEGICLDFANVCIRYAPALEK
jgi:hypothetical protein